MADLSTRRLITTVTLLGTLALAILAFSNQTATAATANPAAQPIKLRYSVPNPPGNADVLQAQFFAKRVKELTNGQVEIQVFDSGILGSDTAALEQVQTGSLDMCSVTAYSNAVKLGSVLELPYLFRDYDHWQKAVDGNPGQTIGKAGLPLGLRFLGYQAGGWRQTYGNKQIKELADFKGFKLRVMPVTAYTELFKAFGAIPTPMSWQETYLALQQKTIDGAETALPSMWTAKQYEVTKYVTLTDHAMSTIAIVFSEQKWKTLPDDVKQVLTRVGKEAVEYQRQEWKKQDADVVNKLKEKGLTIDTIDKGRLQGIAKTQVFSKLVTDPAQKALLDEVLDIK